MTVPLDLGINTWMGMTFSLVAKGKLEGMEAGESVLGSKPYVEGLAFAATVGMGIAGICYKLAPDWMLMYYGDHEKIPPAVQVSMFGLYPAMYTLGFLFAQQLERKKKGLGWVAWSGNFLGVLGYMLVSMDRLLKVGTTGEYEKGEARSIFKTPLAPLLLVGLPGAFPALYYFSKKAAR
jgi:drug/metabolite transporter (DMT)-like permease